MGRCSLKCVNYSPDIIKADLSHKAGISKVARLFLGGGGVDGGSTLNKYIVGKNDSSRSVSEGADDVDNDDVFADAPKKATSKKDRKKLEDLNNNSIVTIAVLDPPKS